MSDRPNESNEATGDSLIVITREEAESGHVDDLLRRQMALRGETGFSAEPRRRWFYQNWILFGVVGLLAALAAWAILEPSLEDYIYVQGKIEAVSFAETLTPEDLKLDPSAAQEIAGQGTITLRGQKIWLFPFLRAVSGTRILGSFDPSTLAPGREVGVFVEHYEVAGNDLTIGHFVDASPKVPAKAKALTPIRDQDQASETASLLLFAVVGAMIGLAIGAADGVVCRVARRAILGGLIGALVGFVGGLFSGVLAGVLYTPISTAAQEQLASPSQTVRSMGFLFQMVARMLAWSLAGAAMGLGQGIALRSKKLLSHGFLGGLIGGMLGGLLFDPLDLVVLGADRVGADQARMIGIAVIGAAVGVMIGVVELLTRDAWLRMVEGPLAGKEFLMFREVMNIGASPRSEIYLFNDPKVAQNHATIRMIGDECEISARDAVSPLFVNGQAIRTSRLRQGDRIQIGDTSFLFEQRQRS